MVAREEVADYSRAHHFKVKLPKLWPHYTQIVMKYNQIYAPQNHVGLVISNKVDACTSHQVTFNGYARTCGCLTGLRNNPQ